MHPVPFAEREGSTKGITFGGGADGGRSRDNLQGGVVET